MKIRNNNNNNNNKTSKADCITLPNYGYILSNISPSKNRQEKDNIRLPWKDVTFQKYKIEIVQKQKNISYEINMKEDIQNVTYKCEVYISSSLLIPLGLRV